MNKKQLLQIDINQIFSIWQKANPQPKCELLHNNNFELLIAVLLSAQATDIGVNKATLKLFAVANNPEKMLELGEQRLNHLIRTIGLHKNKTKHILATCKILIEKHQSKIPSTRHDLESLPGVGRKTANVILNVAFKQNTIAVDTHVARVSNRLGLSSAKTPIKIEQQLHESIPTQYIYHSHLWLILHGRYICKARSPLCTQCDIKNLCQYYNAS